MRLAALVRPGSDLIGFFFQAEDGIRDLIVTGVQTCALPISQDAGDDLMTVQQRRREQHQVRREVAREHGAQQGEPPTSGAERTQLRQPPFAERREAAADPPHLGRTSRATYAPSTARCCGWVSTSPSA